MFKLGNYVGVEGAKSLSVLLKENQSLEELTLVSSKLTEKGVVLLGEALKMNRALKELNVEG